MAVRIYVTRPIFAEALQRLQREAEVHINSEDRVLSKEELISHLRDADGTMALLTDTFDREVLEAASKLKIIANFAVGFNNIDLGAATRSGYPRHKHSRCIDGHHGRFCMGIAHGRRTACC